MSTIFENLEKLLLVSQIARSGSVRRAAQQMRTSQTAVLRSLNIVEDCFQAKLFKRSSTGIELTPVGQEVKEYAERLRLDVAQLVSRVRGFSGKRSRFLHLAASESVSARVISQVVSHLEQREPSARIEVSILNSEALFAGIYQRKIQIALTDEFRADLRLNRHIVLTDSYSFFGRKYKPIPKQLEDLQLAGAPYAMAAGNLTIREHLASLGLLSAMKCASPRIEVALSLAMSSGTIAILPKFSAEEFVQKGLLQEVVQQELGLLEFGDYRIHAYVESETETNALVCGMNLRA